MITLFEHPLSPYAQKVKLALYEKGIEFESKLPDILGGGDAAFHETSPRREVPSIVDGDAAIFDSTIILEYLEDKWPTPAMLPLTPLERARVRMLEEMCDTYYEAINWALYEVRVFGRAKGDLADRLVARAGEQIAGANAWLEHRLGVGDWFNGTQFGWGDLSVFPVVNAAAFNGFPPTPGSRLADWLQRMQLRASVQKVMAAAMESMAGFEALPQIIESGHFVREYRDHRLEWMLRSGGVDIVLDGMKRKNIRFSVELG